MMSKCRNVGLNLNVNVGRNLTEASAAICEVRLVTVILPNS